MDFSDELYGVCGPRGQEHLIDPADPCLTMDYKASLGFVDSIRYVAFSRLRVWRVSQQSTTPRRGFPGSGAVQEVPVRMHFVKDDKKMI